MTADEPGSFLTAADLADLLTAVLLRAEIDAATLDSCLSEITRAVDAGDVLLMEQAYRRLVASDRRGDRALPAQPVTDRPAPSGSAKDAPAEQAVHERVNVIVSRLRSISAADGAAAGEPT
jgi:hypothetical protein